MASSLGLGTKKTKVHISSQGQLLPGPLVTTSTISAPLPIPSLTYSVRKQKAHVDHS